jgi:hypothetical protein
MSRGYKNIHGNVFSQAINVKNKKKSDVNTLNS